MSEKIKKEEIEMKLKQYMMDIMASGEGEAPETIDSEDDLTNLHLNSVDFLEFIIKIEKNFNVDVDDELLVENKNKTIKDWTDYIYNSL
jgi:acyl carrier protein